LNKEGTIPSFRIICGAKYNRKMNPINKHKILKAETNVKNGKEKQESE
jgi:hypothetical protein